MALTEYFVGDATMSETLARVAHLTTAAVPQAVFVGITLLVDEELGTYVFTHPATPEIDRIQHDTGDAPCLDACRSGQPQSLESTSAPDRWLEFARVAAEHGIGSTLSLPMRTPHATVGALDLYAATERAFGPECVVRAMTFATQAAFLLANARAYWDARSRSEGLQAALASRATIEQAKGLIIAATGCSPQEAFDKLRQQSQHENVKLRDVATRLIDQARRRA